MARHGEALGSRQCWGRKRKSWGSAELAKKEMGSRCPKSAERT